MSVERGAMRTYSIVLDPDPDQGGCSVTVPALPGCFTQGETIEGCLTNAREAIELYLADLADSGEAIPEGRVRPQVLTVTIAAA
jgi:antitoxin HicB